MALINDPKITDQIRALANTGTVDSNQIVQILNSVLPAGQQIATTGTTGTGLYKRFGEFDKVNAKIEVVTTGLWSSDSGSLTSFYTSSQVEATSGKYYYNVYQTDPIDTDIEEVQYAVAYGHLDGSGSVSLDNDPNGLLATKATYAQYKSILLDPTLSQFQFENAVAQATNSNEIYVINVARARYRESMDAGNWSLKLSGSNGLFTFIDNSGKKFGDNYGLSGNVFKVVSGSLNLGSQNEATVKNTTDPTSGEGYGLFYPERGIIILNPKAIANVVGNVFNENFQNVGSLLPDYSILADKENHKRLYHAIRAGKDFDARRTENVSTQHFFVRATNREFNYSNNPTYLDADGFFTEPTFETDPQTFITTIGLLNDANEIVAVAKTSQPIVKSFDKEVLIKVKLSF
jgi:hypothetical protein